MPTCWIIEQGEYSDYRVVGIFTTRENAEQALAYMKDPKNHYEEPTISERVLDPAIAELNQGLSQFCVRMLNNGELTVYTKKELDLKDITWNRGACYYTWAKDEQHAIKIAAERHAQHQLTPKDPR
jgi:hypothetical protein